MELLSQIPEALCHHQTLCFLVAV